MAELGKHFEYTLELLAGRIVTPERYGGQIAVAEVVEEDPTLFD